MHLKANALFQQKNLSRRDAMKEIHLPLVKKEFIDKQ